MGRRRRLLWISRMEQYMEGKGIQVSKEELETMYRDHIDAFLGKRRKRKQIDPATWESPADFCLKRIKKRDQLLHKVKDRNN